MGNSVSNIICIASGSFLQKPAQRAFYDNFCDIPGKTDNETVVFEPEYSSEKRKPIQENVSANNFPANSNSTLKAIGLAALGIGAAIGGFLLFRRNICKSTIFSPGKLLPGNLSDMAKKTTRYIDYAPLDKVGKYTEEVTHWHMKFKDFLNPITLPKTKMPRYGQTLHISNFSSPNGTIGIAAPLNQTLSTDGLLSCAALSVVDKKQNIQALFHFCPGVSAKENRTILNYIFANNNFIHPKITIVPGCYSNTDSTVSFLVENIKDILGKKCKINFAHIAEKDFNFITLKNGILSCAKKTRILSENEINSVKDIIFCSNGYKIVNDKIVYSYGK